MTTLHLSVGLPGPLWFMRVEYYSYGDELRRANSHGSSRRAKSNRASHATKPPSARRRRKPAWTWSPLFGWASGSIPSPVGKCRTRPARWSAGPRTWRTPTKSLRSLGDPAGDPAVHPVRTLQAGPATPGRCPSILTTATRTRRPRPPQQQPTGVAPSHSGPAPGGLQAAECGRPIPGRGQAAEAASHLGSVGLRRAHDAPSQPGGGGWTGKGVVTCAQVPPLMLHPRIERPGRVRRNDRRSRRRSGDPHCPSQATGLGQPAAISNYSSVKSAKGQHSFDQTW